MRVCIVGAGNVGRSIALELLANGHEVLLIERNPHAIRSETVPDAEWLLADACEMGSLQEAELQTFDVSIAATGDDKVNLVHTLLAKTEFGVGRTVAGSTTRATSGSSMSSGVSTWRCRRRGSCPRWSRGGHRRGRRPAADVQKGIVVAGRADAAGRLPGRWTPGARHRMPVGAVLVAIVRDGVPAARTGRCP